MLVVVIEVNGGFVENRFLVLDGMFLILIKYVKIVVLFKYFFLLKKMRKVSSLVVIMKILG